MKSVQWGSLALFVTLMIGFTAPVMAQSCNLTACTVNCGGGCGVSFPIQHPNIGYGPAYGAFALQGTSFETTCLGLLGGCTVAVPPVRFWAYNNYDTANSGCVNPVAGQWLANPLPDFGLGGPVPVLGDWVLYQANWAAPTAPSMTTVDGCVTAVAPFPETVAELAFADAMSNEGMTTHSSWYLVAAAPAVSPFDFDTVTGGNLSNPPGSGPANIKPQLVPGIDSLTAGGVLMTCPNHGTPTPGPRNANDMGHYDVNVSSLTRNVADYFTSAGINMGGPLIAGFQMVFTVGAEPTSSDPAVAGWQPVRDQADPVNNVAAIWPLGSAAPTTVSLPQTTSANPHWIAVRIVYTDASLNMQTGAGPAATAPQVVSLTGSHCGPVWGPVTMAVNFDSITAHRTEQGVVIDWVTSSEDDVFGYKVVRADNPQMEASVDAVGFVPSVGSPTGGSYTATDEAVVGAELTTLYYYVQEFTDGGLGQKSPIVEVAGESEEPTGPAGGRQRGSSRR